MQANAPASLQQTSPAQILYYVIGVVIAIDEDERE
jgi:hypothetical protein